VNRREFITLLGGTAATWPLAARAQQAKLVRLGLLDPSRSTDLVALRDLGYVEGRRFQLEQHIAEGHFDRLPGLARELAGLPVDMFLVGGEASIRAAMQATDQIPIIKFDFLIHPLLYQPRRIPRPGRASRSQVCQSRRLDGPSGSALRAAKCS